MKNIGKCLSVMVLCAGLGFWGCAVETSAIKGCEVDSECEKDEECWNGQCILHGQYEKCVENSIKCIDEKQYKKCTEDGAWGIDTIFCSGGRICKDNACIFNGCQDGEIKCVDSKNYEICDNGETWKSESCAENEVCVAGGCVAKIDKVCQPGEQRCVNDYSYKECFRDGVWEELSIDCKDNYVCKQKDDKIECLECLPGTIKCINDGSEYGVKHICDSTGEWKREYCPSNNSCVSDGMSCGECKNGDCRDKYVLCIEKCINGEWSNQI